MAPNFIILWVLSLLLLSISPGLESEDVMPFAKNHLKAFGYLSGDYASIDDDTYDEALVSALRKYQTFYGSNVSGRINPDTLMMMSRPRCGVPDHPATDDVRNNITPQYAFYEGKPAWPKSIKKLKYTFLNVPPISYRNASAAISRAFSTWSAVTGFTFKGVAGISKPAQIHIGFYRGDHGDEKPFDGHGGSFAHSTPPTAGLMHFDADEDWGTIQAANILDLESVALHEIGHILGLEHSNKSSAVMFDSFSYGQIKRRLDQDDIDGIRALYAN